MDDVLYLGLILVFFLSPRVCPERVRRGAGRNPMMPAASPSRACRKESSQVAVVELVASQVLPTSPATSRCRPCRPRRCGNLFP